VILINKLLCLCDHLIASAANDETMNVEMYPTRHRRKFREVLLLLAPCLAFLLLYGWKAMDRSIGVATPIHGLVPEPTKPEFRHHPPPTESAVVGGVVKFKRRPEDLPQGSLRGA
jgi:hypothetical protein